MRAGLRPDVYVGLCERPQPHPLFRFPIPSGRRVRSGRTGWEREIAGHLSTRAKARA